MRTRLMAWLGCVAMLSCAGAAQARFDIVPEPQRVSAGRGAFLLTRTTRITAPADRRAQWIAGFLRGAVRDQTGIALTIAAHAGHSRIELRIDPSIKGDEAYR